jgi:hypothetical protein
MYICDLYDKELKYYYQRNSNNPNPEFTDQEIMTIYLFARHCQKISKSKIYTVLHQNIFPPGFLNYLHFRPLISE